MSGQDRYRSPTVGIGTSGRSKKKRTRFSQKQFLTFESEASFHPGSLGAKFCLILIF